MSLVPYHPREGREIVLYVTATHPAQQSQLKLPVPRYLPGPPLCRAGGRVVLSRRLVRLRTRTALLPPTLEHAIPGKEAFLAFAQGS